jgi:signal transduction histidine kinase
VATLYAQEDPSWRQSRAEKGFALSRAPWVVVVVLIATASSFTASMIYAKRVADRLDGAAMSIATDASPAIEHLAVVRAELLQITITSTSAVERAGGPSSPASRRAVVSQLGQSLARLHAQLSAYLALPFYPREDRLYRTVEQAVAVLEGGVSELSRRLDEGDGRAADLVLMRRVLPAAASADAAVGALVSFNAEQEHGLAMAMPALRGRATKMTLALQIATGVLGIVLTGFVVLGTRSYTRLLQGRERQAADQARDIAAFGAKLESLIASSAHISRAITSSDDPTSIFQLIADEARTIVSARYSAIGFGTDPDRPFDPWISSGTAGGLGALLGHAPRPDGLLGAVVRDGRSIRVVEVTRHPLYRGVPVGHPPLGAFLGVPIVRDGRNVANLYLARAPQEPAFSAQDERAADLLAAYLGVAIENAKLYKEAVKARQAREDLLASVSHDLKAPLSAIKLSAHLLSRQVGPGKAAETVARIDRSAERMSRLVNDLLDAARIEAGVLRANLQPESAAALADAAVELFRVVAAERGIQLVATAPPEPVLVRCERDLILRVFANLLGNAIKFSADGSAISVATDRSGDEARYSVVDAGPGMPAEMIPHAFDRYWQEKRSDRRGSGLGLFIAKGIVEAHGGRIWIESALGQGTTVRFTLPVAPTT